MGDQHRRDLVEWHGEHVVEHERNPLGGSQRLEADEERETDRVAEKHLMLGIDPVIAIEDGLRNEPGEGLLTPRCPRAEHIETDSRSDGRQPPAHVLDVGRVGPADPEHASWMASSASDSEPSIR